MNIQEGRYRLPWDMTTAGHRQFSPTYILNKASRFITEAYQTLERRDAGKPDPVWLGSGMYPEYYLNTFHYQVSDPAESHCRKRALLGQETVSDPTTRM